MCDGREDQPEDCKPAVGTHAMIVDALDDKTHPDHREFALAVADFALLYEPRTENEDEVQGIGGLLSDAQAGEGNAMVLDLNNVNQLEAYARALWEKYGRPVAPPHKPEAISKDHHDPYIVNYRNEPIPFAHW